MLHIARFVLFVVRPNYRYVVMLYLQRRNARLAAAWGVL